MIEAALEQVRLAFADRTMPVHAAYCFCDACREDHEPMERILHSLPADLSDGDLEMLIHKAYWTGLNWPSLAYYVPEMLARLKPGRYFDEDLLLYKLMLATRPDLIMSSGGKVADFIDESMNPAERAAILAYVQAVFDARLHTLSYHKDKDAFHELLAFLLDFDSPITPLFERWKQANDPQARVNLCLFITDYLLNYSDKRQPFMGTYYEKSITPLPENQAALDALLAPEFMANFLMNCADAAELAGPDWETGIGAAFDWAVMLAQRKR